jgi:hypothetical protein
MSQKGLRIVILDIKINPTHSRCRVFHRETGEMICCDYADDVRGIVRGPVYDLVDGKPTNFRADPDTGEIVRFDRREPIRIEWAPGVVPIDRLSLRFKEKNFAEIIRKRDIIFGNSKMRPQAHPDDPDHFPQEYHVSTLGNRERKVFILIVIFAPLSPK